MKKVREKKEEVSVLDVDRYRGEWVALEPVTHRVVAHAISLGKAKRTAIEKGTKRPVMFSVPDSGSLFVGHGMILSRASRV